MFSYQWQIKKSTHKKLIWNNQQSNKLLSREKQVKIRSQTAKYSLKILEEDKQAIVSFLLQSEK